MKKNGLKELIGPTNLPAFVASLNSNEPFATECIQSISEPLCTLPFLESLTTLLAHWPDVVQSYQPKIADEVSAVAVSTKEAQENFASGMSLYFDDVEKLSPLLTDWLNSIRNDLELSTITKSRCLVYATPKGKGTVPHFDQNINFVLQIRGTKTWSLASNQNVDNPLSRHTMGLPPDAELETYLKSPLIETMPLDKKTITLKPGMLLFVPRGTWHSTFAEDDALSLNFTFTAPTWLDLFTAALRSRLALSAPWRETATVSSAESVNFFDLLLSDLKDDLPHWTATEILKATEAK